MDELEKLRDELFPVGWCPTAITKKFQTLQTALSSSLDRERKLREALDGELKWNTPSSEDRLTDYGRGFLHGLQRANYLILEALKSQQQPLETE